MSISNNICGFDIHGPSSSVRNNDYEYLFNLVVIQCPNENCHGYIIETATNPDENLYIGRTIYPAYTFKPYPEYVPLNIRQDYQEACAVKNRSPKAAATLARRCLQGMIHDFWNIREKNLNAEITSLKAHVAVTQWNAIDAIRKIGNIGAHMESDVNLVIDVEPDEADKLLKLIELLLEKWYVSRHDEESLFAEITEIADEKQAARNP
jgi:hypothetical protein